MKEEKQDYLATIFLAVFFLSFGFMMQVIAWWFIFIGDNNYFAFFSIVMIYGGIWMIYFGSIIPTSPSESRPEYRKSSRLPTAPRAHTIPVRQAYATMGSRHHPAMGARARMPRAAHAHPGDEYPRY